MVKHSLNVGDCRIWTPYTSETTPFDRGEIIKVHCPSQAVGESNDFRKWDRMAAVVTLQTAQPGDTLVLRRRRSDGLPTAQLLRDHSFLDPATCDFKALGDAGEFMVPMDSQKPVLIRSTKEGFTEDLFQKVHSVKIGWKILNDYLVCSLDIF